MNNIPLFIYYAFAAGLGVVILAGVLGAFMIWQRLSYFGDSLAHSSLLGISLSLAFNINIHLGIIIVVSILALLLFGLQKKSWLASDTALGILAHASLAFGLLTLSLVQRPSVDFLAYLYGDILTVNAQDLYLIYGGGALILLILGFIYKPLLSLTVHQELARVEGVRVEALRLLYLFLLAGVIALAIKIVGVLLMGALLIIPPATARRFAKSPESLILMAVFVGALALAVGLGVSLSVDVPTGPAIVCVASLFFILSLLL
jgi:zinc transport system permease protein